MRLDPDPKQVERGAWQTRVKETFDFAALAALIKSPPSGLRSRPRLLL